MTTGQEFFICGRCQVYQLHFFIEYFSGWRQYLCPGCGKTTITYDFMTPPAAAMTENPGGEGEHV